MFAVYSFSLGIFSVGLWPQLPGISWLIGGFFVCIFMHALRFKLFVFLAWGLLYGACWGQYALSHQLPEEVSPSDFLVTGEVVGLPVSDGRRVRFNFRLRGDDRPHDLKMLRLSWYYHDATLRPGQVWQLRVKLRRPRGTVNPGGFDYHTWLIRQGVSATGYVRDTEENRIISRHSSVNSLRFQLRETIQLLPIDDGGKALILALTLGDRSLISPKLWDRLALSGVVHLVVISGLHIGLVALLSYCLGALLARFLGLLGWPLTVRYWGSVLSLIVVIFYSAMAGFSLPTQRALIMVVVAIVVLLLNRHVSRGLGFGTALAVVAIVDPLAIFGAGFWLSFGAVAGLLWLVPTAFNTSLWRTLLKIQWLVFAVLLLPLMVCFLPIAWLSPLVNLVAIPWISFLVVPLCLLAAITSPVSTTLSGWLWSAAGWQLELFITMIEAVPSLDFLPRYSPWPLTGFIVCTLSLVIGLVLLPRGIPGRYLCVPLALGLLLIPSGYSRPLVVTILDVGQGLSVVVKTRHRTLVYDTGTSFGKGFSTGSAVVAPFLRRQGTSVLDMLVISHSDNDHAGGTAGLLGAFSPSQLRVGEALELSEVPGRDEISSEFCRSGESWVWDEVMFSFLHPGKQGGNSNNNRSCVLQIQYADQSILLPGDIEADVEGQLLNNPQLATPVTLLVAPHHGSKTSSSYNLVKRLNPANVVFSAGYRHHFGHPALPVTERYQRQGSRLWNTAESGALTFTWSDSGLISVSEARSQSKRYWY
ncbi:MAG: DNA internalization-related competence protein ComEC/Rec2 [Porticoccus sp.]|nr:DNA internalization-related competence protein ComEC/Rec2 [Porticoccus sp.]MBQ0808170.1 DNA internalization-related competence protein ComEC/Rec2 [Porticoccus sp.]